MMWAMLKKMKPKCDIRVSLMPSILCFAYSKGKSFCSYPENFVAITQVKAEKSEIMWPNLRVV